MLIIELKLISAQSVSVVVLVAAVVRLQGRGEKGYYSRSGAGGLKGFIGGQSPLRQRLPKRGFNNANFRTSYIPVNLEWIEENFAAGDEVNAQTIKAKGIKLGRDGKIKFLGTGDLTKSLVITAECVLANLHLRRLNRLAARL